MFSDATQNNLAAADPETPWRGRNHQGSGGDHEGFAGTFERCSDRFDGTEVGLNRGREVRGFGDVVESRVDDTVRCDRAAPQAVEVVERTAVHLGAGGLQCCGGRVRAGEADDLMPRRKQLADDGRTDVSACSGNENSHGKFLQ